MHAAMDKSRRIFHSLHFSTAKLYITKDFELKTDGADLPELEWRTSRSLPNRRQQGWLHAGHVKLDDQAWYDGCGDWILIQDLPGIGKSSAGHATSSDLIPPFEAYEGSDPFIFISYAHKDSEIVYEEITELHESGYKIWYDEGIEASNEWPEEIANAVIGCAVFVVFISPRSTASVNCRNEINLALNENKPFLAIHLEESDLPPGLRLRMGDLQAILRYRLTRDRYLKKVNGTLDQLLGRKNSKAASPSSPKQREVSHKAQEKKPESVILKPKSTGRRGLLMILGTLVLIAVSAFVFVSKKIVPARKMGMMVDEFFLRGWTGMGSQEARGLGFQCSMGKPDRLENFGG